MRLIVFDLDGTLIDSQLDLAGSLNATLEHFGLRSLPLDTVTSFVGDGAAMLVRRALEVSRSNHLFEPAFAFFLDYYRDHCLDHTVLYPGVRELLGELTRCRLVLTVLTNKPVALSKRILSALTENGSFSEIYGGDSFPGHRKPDPFGIHALRKLADAPAGATLMVGDSHVDILTARNAGIPSCGVRWGLQPESMLEARPDFIIERPLDLLSHLTLQPVHG